MFEYWQNIYIFFKLLLHQQGYAKAQLVEEWRYKSESSVFDPRRNILNVSFT
jgi:hypothetical protein